MNEALTDFIGWHTLIFGLACWVLTFFTRRIVETAIPHLKKQADANAPDATYRTTFARWWNEVILYALPVAWGAISASLMTMYPFPQGLTSFSARLFFGIVVGFFSGFIYKILKKIVLKKFDIVDEGDLPTAKAPEPAGD